MVEACWIVEIKSLLHLQRVWMQSQTLYWFSLIIQCRQKNAKLRWVTFSRWSIGQFLYTPKVVKEPRRCLTLSVPRTLGSFSLHSLGLAIWTPIGMISPKWWISLFPVSNMWQCALFHMSNYFFLYLLCRMYTSSNISDVWEKSSINSNEYQFVSPNCFFVSLFMNGSLALIMHCHSYITIFVRSFFRFDFYYCDSGL